MIDDTNTLPVEGLDEDAAIARIAEKMGAPKATPGTESDDDELPDSEDEESEEAEAEDTEEPEDEDVEEQPAKVKLEEVEVDGKKFQLPPELKPYLLRQQDYTRKTQEVAEIRRAAEAETQTARQRHQEYVQGLELVELALQTFSPQPPDPKLLDEDPVEFTRQKHVYDVQLQRFHAAHNERMRAMQQFQQEQQQHITQQMRQQMEKAQRDLLEMLPEWKDEARATKERAELRDYLKSQGFTAEEVATATDPRAVVLARKARLYDEMQKRKSAAKEQPTKVVPPTPPKSKQAHSQTQMRNARSALHKTGDPRAAEFLIAQKLKKQGLL